MIQTYIYNLKEIKSFEKHIVLSKEEILNKIVAQYLNNEISSVEACQLSKLPLKEFLKLSKAKSIKSISSFKSVFQK